MSEVMIIGDRRVSSMRVYHTVDIDVLAKAVVVCEQMGDDIDAETVMERVETEYWANGCAGFDKMPDPEERIKLQAIQLFPEYYF